MVQIIFSEEVINYIDDLTFELYQKEYFSYIDVAKKYVDYIINEISTSIHEKKHNETPYQYNQFGKYYIIIVTNRRTAWHVYFDKKNDIYLIKKLENNHLPSAKFLNEL